MKWILLSAMVMATAMMSCNNDGGADEPLSNENNERRDISLTRSETQLVSQNNDFAFNLFRQVQEGHEDESQIVSPISITYALGMLNNGAAGDTRQQINTVLGFKDTGADAINDFCKKMLDEAPTLDKLTKVMIANTIYMNKGYELKADFKKTARDFYGASPETRDFHDGKTMRVINQWASDHTEKMITEVLTEDSFNPDAISYLLNAIYFKGAWSEKFNTSNTKDEAFDGGHKVPMMRQEHEFGYMEDDQYQALSLPYGNKAFCMTVLLPREGKTTGDVLDGLDGERWQHTLQQMRHALVDVKLPRFESNTDLDLNAVMATLGMPNAFDPQVADFSYFCNVPTYIGMMKQVARIKLNEEGTEAAAVTVIGMEMASAGPSEPRRVEFHATRPFVYVISERSTGAIFFIGKYTGD